MPLATWRYCMLWPPSWPITIRNRNTKVTASHGAMGDRTLYEWRRDDGTPCQMRVTRLAGMPLLAIYVSSMPSWEGIISRTIPLYAGKNRIPEALVSRVHQIEAKYPRAEDRITEALRLVQDQLRYVSLSTGNGSYVPRDPDVVFRSGYGDCKDKASLLAALLNSISIEAHVALDRRR